MTSHQSVQQSRLEGLRWHRRRLVEGVSVRSAASRSSLIVHIKVRVVLFVFCSCFCFIHLSLTFHLSPPLRWHKTTPHRGEGQSETQPILTGTCHMVSFSRFFLMISGKKNNCRTIEKDLMQFLFLQHKQRPQFQLLLKPQQKNQSFLSSN